MSTWPEATPWLSILWFLLPPSCASVCAGVNKPTRKPLLTLLSERTSATRYPAQSRPALARKPLSSIALRSPRLAPPPTSDSHPAAPAWDPHGHLVGPNPVSPLPQPSRAHSSRPQQQPLSPHTAGD